MEDSRITATKEFIKDYISVFNGYLFDINTLYRSNSRKNNFMKNKRKKNHKITNYTLKSVKVSSLYPRAIEISVNYTLMNKMNSEIINQLLHVSMDVNRSLYIIDEQYY